jgi:quercetin dioxygenase-like cupin family protein/Pyruvate/2-oxoacid:ferredoxin oxidoreductase delta subunit
MKRNIITIDADRCSGCGNCITGCPEGAIQLIDGKARLVSDLFCDGLGACIGTCPEGAITIEEREAEPYNEALVLENIIPHGANTIKAHLKHLKDHGETKYHTQALEILKDKGFNIEELSREETMACGCSGTHARKIEKPVPVPTPAPAQAPAAAPAPAPAPKGKVDSELRQWPVQLTLINPASDYFDNADLLISADCVPYAYGNFQRDFLKGKIVITFCPKLDKGLDRYIDKLAQIFTLHTIKSLTVVRMEVPCCGGIEVILQKALEQAGKSMPIVSHIISVEGEVISTTGLLRSRTWKDIPPVLDKPGKLGVKVYDAPEGEIVYMALEPGAVIAPHITPVNVAFYVLEGTITLQIGDEKQAFPADTVIDSPKDIPHAVYNESGAPARILVIKMPKP